MSAVAVVADRVDPARVFAGIAAEYDDVFWLDAGPDAADGWSWMGHGRRDDPAQVRAVRAGGGIRTPGSDAATDGAGRFRSGWVGWSGYEPAAAGAGAPITADTLDVPADCWIRVTAMVAFDHATGRAWAIADDAEAWAARVREWAASASARVAVPGVAQVARARHHPAAYAALVERCREVIRDGIAYQLCLTTRFDVVGAVDPVSAFTALRAATPAHHAGIIRTGGHALVSASPERFLEVTAGVVRTHPIKGTRPRGADAEDDRRLAEELLASPKERAENVMIVDLMRNDLSRVCDPATVVVERLLAVESYPAVHQLVSTVAGRLRETATVGDLLNAAFPAGSMTGAPKLSAMTVLHALEGAPRGVFAGCFGWIGDDGDLDLAMVIRSIVTHPSGAYVGAGGGITWHSDPAAEVAEVAVKARAPLAALGARLPAGW